MLNSFVIDLHPYFLYQMSYLSNVQGSNVVILVVDSWLICFWWGHRGPEGVKIENADTAIAVVTGLQEGEYIFMLTVTDERMLENSDTVSVIVREGVRP